MPDLQPLPPHMISELVVAALSEDWGRLGVMAQFRCEVESLFEVPPEAFYPPPKVHSAVVRLTPHPRPAYPNVDPTSLARVVTQAFSKRRKTLRNNFKGTMEDNDFGALAIDPSARAETLSIKDFVAIAAHLCG